MTNLEIEIAIVSFMKKDINKLSADITALKKELRQPYKLVTYKEAAQLEKLKSSVTELCQTRAHMRNRLHMTKVRQLYTATPEYRTVDKEEQKVIADKIIAKYIKSIG